MHEDLKSQPRQGLLSLMDQSRCLLFIEFAEVACHRLHHGKIIATLQRPNTGQPEIRVSTVHFCLPAQQNQQLTATENLKNLSLCPKLRQANSDREHTHPRR
jgi:hypothetical protein